MGKFLAIVATLSSALAILVVLISGEGLSFSASIILLSALLVANVALGFGIALAEKMANWGR